MIFKCHIDNLRAHCGCGVGGGAEITHLCKNIQCKVAGSVLLSLAQLVELQFYQTRSIIGLESESESVLFSMLDILNGAIFLAFSMLDIFNGAIFVTFFRLS